MILLLARVVGIGIETADMLVQEVLSRKLRDRRAGTPARDVTLRGVAAAVYVAADAGATLDELVARVPSGVKPAEIQELLADLVARRYMYEERGKYLSLAVADRPLLAYDPDASAHLRGGAAVAV